MWRSERRSKLGGIRPDGLGVVRAPRGEISFWLEVDLGTENHERLRHKLIWYRQSAPLPHALPHAVLFCFHSEARETHARRALGEVPGFVVATATLGRHRADPLAPIWLPVRGARRTSLLDLPLPERDDLLFRSESLVPREDDIGW